MAQMPDVVPQIKGWVEELVSQRPYSEHAWMELSKGRREARNHGLPKDVAIRPPSDDEDVPLESPVPSYLRCLVTEEDQVVMAAVKAPCLFNKAQQALNQASVLHHETFLQYREELAQHEAEVWELTEKKRDTYKLLSEKLQAELEVAQKEHAEWAEQEVVQAQLASAEAQLWAAKEKNLVQAKKIEELQSELNSAISGQESLAKELEATRSEVVVAKTKADAKVALFKVDVEAIQAQAKSMVEHARWQARREALEGVHPQSFNILAEIENAKVEEARARKLAFSEEDSESLTESEGGEDPEDEEAAPDED
ncbi:uncharacterized protein [Nicotiana tomentosiformis]|uniref:uncharacterized protein n=1 Tax=Nicotiana tomentosiformis TaxID=4098 RepID=UPI00388C675D